MDDYAGRILADRYRLPVHPSGEDRYDLAESLAFDTYSGQEVRVRQIPLPEVVEAEVLDADGLPEGYSAAQGRGGREGGEPVEPAVRRALEAAREAARLADHPRLDQVYDVFAEGGSLWVVGEAVPGRPLGDLLAERTLTPYRAAEVAADLLMAIRVLHGHGWVHRNITPRTVVVCEDGRVVLTGLAAGAAEEALCGYDPVPPETPPLDAPEPPGAEPETFGADGGAGIDAGAGTRELGPGSGTAGAGHETYGAGAYGAEAGAYGTGTSEAGAYGAGSYRSETSGAGTFGAGTSGAGAYGAGAQGRGTELEASASAGALPAAGLPAPSPSSDRWSPNPVPPYWPAPAGSGPNGEPGRGASSGSAAAYRDGVRAAAARVEEARAAQREVVQERGGDRPALPGARTPVEGASGSQEQGNPPGRIADPYGVQGRPAWHGATPRSGAPATWPASPDSPPSTGPGSRPAIAPVPLQARQPLPNLPAPAPLPPAAPMPAALPEPASSSELEPSAGSASSSGGPVPPSGQGAPSAPAPSAPRRGPATLLAAERARQARMTVVGAVTERWAPEQAHPVHDHWQLAAPVGPATDLWALGALLFRAVQGHAPYPEDSTAELVQLVCSEPPAFAEECGPLRPVVESLLRQDPTDRPDIEELGGWLRSLVRSAPEPEAGAHLVALPPADPERLPMVRRKGELVRRRRDARRDAAASRARHRRAGADRTARSARAERVDRMDHMDRPEPRDHERSPRKLGRTLLTLVLLLLAGAIAYAMFFMPKSGEQAGGQDRSGNSFPADTTPTEDTGDSGEAKDPDEKPTPSASPSKKAPAESPEDTGEAGGEVAEGFTLRKDPEGFQVAVASGWQRAPRNGRGQVVFSKGDFRLIVVPGRDSAEQYGRDPQVYQQEHEPELQPYRDSTWAGSGGLRRIEVGGKVMAEGEFTWTDDQGRKLFVRNLAILDGGRYHVVQLRGPEAEKDQVTRLFEQASATYEYVR
ncbi:serine/threonine protein kinase [Streptomyces sp. NPDC002734]|uniref:serine/threonine protein kinase n=1 Tax=Streptomyces sp. NPDC002734 TaxID=3154426 RepID=UPI00331D5C6F